VNRLPQIGQQGVVIALAVANTTTDAYVIRQSLHTPECFFELFERHFHAMHRFMCARGAGEAAEDLASETFLVAYRRRASYDLSRPDARPWLFGIGINLARNAARSHRRGLRAFSGALERPVEPHDGVAERIDARRLRLAEALDALTAEERDALVLFACEELSYDEIAEVLAVPVGTVRSRLHRARMKVRASLASTDGGMDRDGR
jgi:RNA polymerase sigma factor (sigma-70 family)